jgi:DNA repair protein RadC
MNPFPHFTIKQWSESDRPREKLLKQGARALSSAELLAILIGSGNSKESAVRLSQRILASVSNSLTELEKMAVSQLTKFRGIGNAKAVSISAALELSRRRRFENSENLSKITSSQNAFELLRPLIGDLPHEEFWIVFLNNSHVFLGCQQLSKGGISQTTVDIRLALKQALLHESTAIILAHNHPSGTLKPSASDHEITKKFRKGCDILDVKLLDHLIVTENSYFSFADNGDL